MSTMWIPSVCGREALKYLVWSNDSVVAWFVRLMDAHNFAAMHSVAFKTADVCLEYDGSHIRRYRQGRKVD